MSFFHEMETLSRTVDRMLARHGLDGSHGLLRTWAEAEDDRVVQDADGWKISVDVPGCRREDVQVSVEKGLLTVRASQQAVLPEGAKLVHRERSTTDTTRVWRVPADVDVDAIGADLADGVLTLSLPRSAAHQPRRIEVR